MKLRRFVKFNEWYQYSPECPEKVTTIIPTLGQRPSPDGFVDWLGDQCLALCRIEGTLYLEIDGCRLKFADSLISLRDHQSQRVLIVESAGYSHQIAYERPVRDPLPGSDFTAFVEDEDFDFGLFLANLSKDKGRQDRLFVSR